MSTTAPGMTLTLNWSPTFTGVLGGGINEGERVFPLDWAEFISNREKWRIKRRRGTSGEWLNSLDDSINIFVDRSAHGRPFFLRVGVVLEIGCGLDELEVINCVVSKNRRTKNWKKNWRVPWVCMQELTHGPLPGDRSSFARREKPKHLDMRRDNHGTQRTLVLLKNSQSLVNFLEGRRRVGLWSLHGLLVNDQVSEASWQLTSIDLGFVMTMDKVSSPPRHSVSHKSTPTGSRFFAFSHFVKIQIAIVGSTFLFYNSTNDLFCKLHFVFLQ